MWEPDKLAPHSLCTCHGQDPRCCQCKQQQTCTQKIKLPNKTKFQAGVWNTGTPKEFSCTWNKQFMHVTVWGCFLIMKQPVRTVLSLRTYMIWWSTTSRLLRKLALTSPSSMTSSWSRRVTSPTWINMRKTSITDTSIAALTSAASAEAEVLAAWLLALDKLHSAVKSSPSGGVSYGWDICGVGWGWLVPC